MSNNQGTEESLKRQHDKWWAEQREQDRQHEERALWCHCEEPIPLGSIHGGLDSCRRCDKAIRLRVLSALVQRLLAG